MCFSINSYHYRSTEQEGTYKCYWNKEYYLYENSFGNKHKGIQSGIINTYVVYYVSKNLQFCLNPITETQG